MEQDQSLCDSAAGAETRQFTLATGESSLRAKKPAVKRKITQSCHWCDGVDKQHEMEILKEWPVVNSPMAGIAISGLKQKLAGYRAQDKEKLWFEPAKFIQLSQLVELLISYELKCCYCSKDVRLLYENIREPMQWSLDRINNIRGHNSDNVCVSCLSCNLKRRITHYSRFSAGANVVINKITTNI